MPPDDPASPAAWGRRARLKLAVNQIETEDTEWAKHNPANISRHADGSWIGSPALDLDIVPYRPRRSSLD